MKPVIGSAPLLPARGEGDGSCYAIVIPGRTSRQRRANPEFSLLTISGFRVRSLALAPRNDKL